MIQISITNHSDGTIIVHYGSVTFDFFSTDSNVSLEEIFNRVKDLTANDSTPDTVECDECHDKFCTDWGDPREIVHRTNHDGTQEIRMLCGCCYHELFDDCEPKSIFG